MIERHSKVFVPVSVDTKLPGDSSCKFVITTLTDNEIASFENGEWDGDLRGDEKNPEKVTHWLEEKENVYVLTEDELNSFANFIAGGNDVPDAIERFLNTQEALKAHTNMIVGEAVKEFLQSKTNPQTENK